MKCRRCDTNMMYLGETRDYEHYYCPLCSKTYAIPKKKRKRLPFDLVFAKLEHYEVNQKDNTITITIKKETSLENAVNILSKYVGQDVTIGFAMLIRNIGKGED